MIVVGNQVGLTHHGFPMTHDPWAFPLTQDAEGRGILQRARDVVKEEPPGLWIVRVTLVGSGWMRSVVRPPHKQLAS